MSEASREHKKQLLLRELANMPIVEVVCKRTSVSRATYYRWRNEDKEFQASSDKALFEATELMSDMAESQLLNSIKDGNMTGIIFWLKSHREAYSNRLAVHRVEVERDAYKQALRDKREEEDDKLRAIIDHMRGIALKSIDEEASKAEQQAIKNKASHDSEAL